MATALEHIDRLSTVQCDSQARRRQIVGTIVEFAERHGKRVNVAACVIYIKTGKNKTRLCYDVDEVK